MVERGSGKVGSRRRVRGSDPAVMAAIEGGQGRGRPGGPGRRRRRRRRARPGRVTLELDVRIKAIIQEVAQAEGISPAGLVNLFVGDALGRYRSGELEVAQHVRESRNTVFEFVVVLDDVLEGGD